MRSATWPPLSASADVAGEAVDAEDKAVDADVILVAPIQQCIAARHCPFPRIRPSLAPRVHQSVACLRRIQAARASCRPEIEQRAASGRTQALSGGIQRQSFRPELSVNR
jgi:hypothetical protein